MPPTPTHVQYPVAVIGDVHGHIDLLDGLLARLRVIAPDHTLVFLGDFVDRGPAVKAVVERVVGLVAGGRAAAVMGNHDLAFVRAAGREGGPHGPWWRGRYLDCNNAESTMTSYLGRRPTARNRAAALDEIRETMPPSHREFLATLPWLVSTPARDEEGGSIHGGHLFLHAGLSRNVTLTAAQQVGALATRRWAAWMARAGPGFTPRDEYPPWLGADRSACADPLPLFNWCQVTGHETVDAPTVVGSMTAIRIDTSGGAWEPLTACLLDGPAGAVKFVSYPEQPQPRGCLFERA